MKVRKALMLGFSSLLLPFWLVNCGSTSGSDDSAARAAFNASDVVIAQGTVDELEYEVREDTVRFTNPTGLSASFAQKNKDGETVDVNSIRAESTTDFLGNLLSGQEGDGITTHRFIHPDAEFGEIFFKGEYSIVGEVVGFIKDDLLETASSASVTLAICFFGRANDRDSHTSSQLENDVEACFTELAVSTVLAAEQSTILNRITNVALTINTSAVTEQIPLRADTSEGDSLP